MSVMATAVARSSRARTDAVLSGAVDLARAAADKRISNARLLREIGVEFQYPSYREGLAAIVRA